MSDKRTAVFGIYPTESAEAAVDALRTEGFRATDISVLFPQNVGSKELGHGRARNPLKAPSPAASIARSSAGRWGWLAGIGLLAIPGIRPFIAAGPIVAASQAWARAAP